ncbi:efflux RND transporter periplasmic adaptor subunit [Luminiphilus sp.]|jgi:RND family efflux transporter MFP subunit|nr:efflux RND transporter periplasmic adaptor subunit [Luminiphilus sp.]
MCHGKRAATALLIALFFTGCDGQSESTQDLESVGVGATPLAVSTVLLDLTELTEPIFVTGTILPLKSTDIAPLVGGLIDEIYVRVGDRVEKGEPLFRMRQKDFEIKLSRLVNAERLAEAEFTDAKRDLENAVALRKKDAFSVEQLDDRQTRVEVTNARRGIARANLAEAQKELDDSTTLAPYRGVITRRGVDEGTYIPSIMRSERSVLQIQKIDIMVALLYVPEVHLQSIELGTPGRVHIPSMNQTYESKVDLINDRIDPKTRTIDVRLGVLNPDYQIKPGLFIEVELIPKPRQGILLPPNSTKGLGSTRYLFVVENGIASQRQVKVRELNDGSLELLDDIAPNTRIIVGKSIHMVSDGASVIISDQSYVDS